MFDGVFDGVFDGLFDGMFDGMFYKVRPGVFNETYMDDVEELADALGSSVFFLKSALRSMPTATAEGPARNSKAPKGVSRGSFRRCPRIRP